MSTIGAPPKHTPTPGPWRFECGEIFAADGECLGVMYRTEAWTSGDPVLSEDQANARLIVRAVNSHDDLLAALKRPIVFTVEESEDVVRLSLDGIEIAAVDFNSAAAGALLQFDAAARAAIAKSEGR